MKTRVGLNEQFVDVVGAVELIVNEKFAAEYLMICIRFLKFYNYMDSRNAHNEKPFNKRKSI